MALNLSGNFINQLPGYFFMKSLDLEYIHCNQKVVDFLGFKYQEDLIGRTDSKVRAINPELAIEYEKQDKSVLKNEKSISSICVHPEEDSQPLVVYIQKSIYFEKGKPSAILGYCTELSHKKIIKLFAYINKFNYNSYKTKKYTPSSYIIDDKYGDLYLTKKESSCYFHFIRGLTAREISLKMNVSKRTTEDHISNIKAKLNCTTRSEVIESAVSAGHINIIPNDIFLSSS